MWAYNVGMARMTKFNKQVPPATDNFICHSLSLGHLCRLGELYFMGVDYDN